jgi:hypothetical protein
MVKITKAQIKENRHRLIDIYKMSKGCEICGYNKLPYNLCFDHLPGCEKSDHVKNGYSKRSSAGGMYRLYNASHSSDELIAEISKCRVLCSLCHMEHTHSKKNSRSIENIVERFDNIDELKKRILEFENNE